LTFEIVCFPKKHSNHCVDSQHPFTDILEKAVTERTGEKPAHHLLQLLCPENSDSPTQVGLSVEGKKTLRESQCGERVEMAVRRKKRRTSMALLS
jgi:hypothetical protein